MRDARLGLHLISTGLRVLIGRADPWDTDGYCIHCGIPEELDDRGHRGPDPCLGHLPGVTAACCGHGSRRDSYIRFRDGTIIRGFKAPE